MKNKETMLYQLTETSLFHMAFVIVTREDNVIIVDGGRPLDMPLLKEYVGGRHISAWILTHAHEDHISGLIDELARNGGRDFDVETFYLNFPPYSLMDTVDRSLVPNYEYFCRELNNSLADFDKVRPLIEDKIHTVIQGESITVDELKIDFLFSFHDGLYANLMNDASLVFKVHGPNKTVLFLGDLGPDAGDFLFRESRHLLKSDIVQMAHHGHMNIGMEVYAEILPEACMWCAPMWLYEEGEFPQYLSKTEQHFKDRRMRMYGTAVTRKWMDLLGVKKHYVTGEGTQSIVI